MKYSSIKYFTSFIFLLACETVAAQWQDVGGGTDAYVNCMCEYDGKLFVGGYFYQPQYQIATDFNASWQNESWSQQYDIGDEERVNAFKYFQGSFYLGYEGPDEMYGGMRKWNGSSWQSIPGCPLGETVNGFEEFHDTLFIASFGDWMWYYDGTTWGHLIDTFGYGGVDQLIVYRDSLYAIGFFQTINGDPIKRVAKWNGHTWSQLGNGIAGGGEVYCGAVYNNELYVGGTFLASEGNPSSYIMKWNDTTWLAVGSGANGSISALDSAYGHLFAGGNFTTINGDSAYYASEYYDGQWHPMGSGFKALYPYHAVGCIYPFNGQVYYGGHIDHAGGMNISNIARWGNYLSTDEIASSNSLSLFPNPTSTSFQFNYTITAPSHIIMYDAYGRIVKELVLDASANSIIISTDELADGVYLLSLTSGDKSVLKKIVVAK